MNDIELYQIYHVARCGSTLLTSLLSSCAPTYSEPHWAHTLDNAKFISPDILEYKQSIVKFSSITTRIGFKPEGPKVFIYRPLAQYLLKMEECGKGWLENRKHLYGTFFDQILGESLKHLYPNDARQLHTIFWASCVLEMQKFDDVLWIKSNKFFLNKENIAKQVLTHFKIEESPDMRFSTINVKSLRLNNNGRIQPFEYYKTGENVPDNRGIIETKTALENQQIFETIEWSKLNISLNPELYY